MTLRVGVGQGTRPTSTASATCRVFAVPRGAPAIGVVVAEPQPLAADPAPTDHQDVQDGRAGPLQAGDGRGSRSVDDQASARPRATRSWRRRPRSTPPGRSGSGLAAMARPGRPRRHRPDGPNRRRAGRRFRRWTRSVARLGRRSTDRARRRRVDPSTDLNRPGASDRDRGLRRRCLDLARRPQARCGGQVVEPPGDPVPDLRRFFTASKLRQGPPKRRGRARLRERAGPPRGQARTDARARSRRPT